MNPCEVTVHAQKKKKKKKGRKRRREETRYANGHYISWVSVISTGKVSDDCIRDLGFNSRLHQNLLVSWFDDMIKSYHHERML